jgi:hypothetical protein
MLDGAVVRGSMMGGVHVGIVRLFAGVTLRNHPTNTQEDTAMTDQPDATEGDIEFGPLYATAGVGVAVAAGRYVDLMAQIFQPLPLYRHDIMYGPIAGVALDIHLPR